ncbi:MAG: DUF4230 domain-containing protein, partial [Chloroflexales bacterium]|nr:DUF4230 domain-containing protein [Chloroflexales bacterium]
IANLLRPLPETSTAIDGQGILRRIQALNSLEAAAFHMEAVVPQNKAGTWWKAWQDAQKAIFISDGTVVAGINLSKLTADDVQVSADGKMIHITLPPAELLNVSVTELKAMNIQTGLLGLVHLDEELRQQAQHDALARLQSIACDSGILEVATENSARDIERLFALMDGVEVVVDSTPAGSCTVPTEL